MFIYIARLIVIISGPVIGYMKISSDGRGILIGTAVGIIVIAIEILIQRVKLDDMVAVALGVIMGLIAASLVTYVVPVLITNKLIENAIEQYRLLLSIVFAYVGMIIALNKKSELDLLDKNITLTSRTLMKGLKVIDASAIIDGRLIDVVLTGFIEGVLIIPSFIINELQALADSSNEEKRNKARRAMDLVSELRSNDMITVKIYKKEYPNIKDNDAKLIKICQEIKARLITTDFNLNKSAKAQGIDILNVNELSNALKPKLLPGEAVEIFILKKGRDKSQGIGFLDDGTMVVVDGGLNYIGKKAEVTVKSVLQKPSGRMIFATIN
ncbi:PIN/TRAM domain-containing protein [Elusimicrobiota bacterium]